MNIEVVLAQSYPASFVVNIVLTSLLYLPTRRFLYVRFESFPVPFTPFLFEIKFIKDQLDTNIEPGSDGLYNLFLVNRKQCIFLPQCISSNRSPEIWGCHYPYSQKRRPEPSSSFSQIPVSYVFIQNILWPQMAPIFRIFLGVYGYHPKKMFPADQTIIIIVVFEELNRSRKEQSVKCVEWGNASQPTAAN